jgi:chromosome segregation ATPase
METINRSEDKLQKRVGDLQAKIAGAEAQLREFQGKLESAELEVADCASQFEVVCKSEALGELKDIGDRTKVEAALSSANARARGFRRLITEQNDDISAMRSELSPILAELGAIQRRGAVESELARVAQSFADGNQEVAEHQKIQNSFHQRIHGLREYAGEEEVVRAAKQAAASLERLWAGLRP